MSTNNRFSNVWDAVEDDPIIRENLKMRSALMIELTRRIRGQGLTQCQAARALRTTRLRVKYLLEGDINKFRLDKLVDMAHRLGIRVSMRITPQKSSNDRDQSESLARTH